MAFLGLVDGDVYHHACLWGTTTLEEYAANYERVLDSLRTALSPEDLLVFRGGKTNFRQTFVDDYKGTKTRVAAKLVRPNHEPACEAWLAAQSFTVVITPEWVARHTENELYRSSLVETDDALAIFASTMKNELVETVIITTDKDLRQVPGWYYHTGYEALLNITPEAAFRNLQLQLLAGDSVDKIPGLRGVGVKTAAKLLTQNSDARVHYRARYGDQWETEFLKTGRLIFLLRHFEDAFSLERYEELRLSAERPLDSLAPGL